MTTEYISLLKSFIITNTYFIVDDTLDSLISDLDEVASSKKGSDELRAINQARHKTVLYRKHNDKRLQYPDLFFCGTCKSPKKEIN